MIGKRRILGITAIGVCLLAAAVGATLWWRDRPALPPTITVDSTESETDLLAASRGLAWREGPALHLLLQSGGELVLTDHQRCGDLDCPPMLATHYRFGGWDAKIGGYRLQVSLGRTEPMVLTFADDEPALLDARHAAAAGAELPMPAKPPAASKPDDSLAEWLADLNADRQQNEKPQLDKYGDRASRDGAVLRLALTGGRHFDLEDDLACGQQACPPQISRSFNYAGESPDGRFALVQQEWNESEEGLLIDRDGGVTETLSVPSFAPDGQSGVALLSDLEEGASRRLEVWSLSGAKPVLAFSIPAKDDDDTIYQLMGWVDATHVRLKRGSWGSDRRTQVMLVKDNAGWHIEEGDL